MSEEEEGSDTRRTAPRTLTGRLGQRGAGRHKKKETADGCRPDSVE